MKGLLSILLVADQATTSIENLGRVVEYGLAHVDEVDIMVVTNGCSPDVFETIAVVIHKMANAKLIKLNSKTDPDSAILEGLQRSIGDYVFVGSINDAAASLIPEMLHMASVGHEVIVVQPRVSNMTYAPSRLDYGTRLMTRAAVHFVTHSGGSPKSAYHLLATHALFAPAMLTHEVDKKPAESLVRGLRRQWRALISSRIGPLRLVSGLALLGAVANIAYSIYVLSVFILKNEVAPGWATLSLQSAGMNLLFSLALFVLTEYIIGFIRSGQVNQQVRIEQEIRSRTVTFDQQNLERT